MNLGRACLSLAVVGLLVSVASASVTVQLRPQSYDPNSPYWRYYGVTPGQSFSVTFNIYAIVMGVDPNTDKKEGFNQGGMSLLSANNYTDPNKAAGLGPLTGAKYAPFDALGSSIGTKRDLDGDTDTDIGTNSGTSGLYVAISSGMQYAPQTEVGNFAWEWKIGTVRFDGNSPAVLVKDANTTVYPRAYKASSTAWVWYEDGNAKNASTGTIVDGQANGIIVYQKWAEANANGNGGYRIIQGGALNLSGKGAVSSYTGIAGHQWRFNGDPNVFATDPNGSVPFSVLQAMGQGNPGAHPLTLTVTAKDGASGSGGGSVSVLSHADGSFDPNLEKKTLLIDFGPLNKNGSASQHFNITNLDVGSGYTAALNLLGAVETSDPGGKFSLNPSISFSNLAGGQTSSFFDVFFDLSTEGTFTGSYTLNLSDENLPGAQNQTMTVNVTGTVIPEPATVGLLALGVVGLVARRRRIA
jgi:hypothetical protein